MPHTIYHTDLQTDKTVLKHSLAILQAALPVLQPWDSWQGTVNHLGAADLQPHTTSNGIASRKFAISQVLLQGSNAACCCLACCPVETPA